MVQITKEQFLQIASDVKLSQEQQDKLWQAMQALPKGRSLLNFAHLAFYFGAILVILAMTWFLSSTFFALGGEGIVSIALLYGFGFGYGGWYFWRKGQHTVGGLLYTVAVCVSFLAVYGIQVWMGSGYVGHYWVNALVTACIAVLTLGFVPFPFLLVPLYFSLWIVLHGVVDSELLQNWLGIVLGVLLTAIGFMQDGRLRGRDYAFWSYLFGLVGFSYHLLLLTHGNEFGLAIFALSQVLLMCASVPLKRSLFLVVGALGLFAYLCYLSYTVFADSMLFPFVLVFIGVVVFFLGVYYQRHREKVDGWFSHLLPAGLYHFLDKEKR